MLELDPGAPGQPEVDTTVSNISDTGQGILVGAEPAQPRMAN